MPRVSKRLIYQRAVWQLPVNIDLKTAIADALSAVREADRCQPLSDDANPNEGTWRKLIRGLGRNGCLFGKMVQYTHGMQQETIRTAPATPEASPDGALAAPAGQEFSGGTLYFCVDGDHVVVAQSIGLRISQLENYLNWLLREKAGVIQRENYVSLHSMPANEAREALSRTIPTAVTFSRPIQLDRPETVTAARRLDTAELIRAAEALMGAGDLRQMLPEGALAEGRVKTSITFSWNNNVGGQRPGDFLQGLGRFALRHLDEDPDADVVIKTKAGNFSRKELSMAESKTLDAPDGVLNTHSVYTAMLEFLSRLRREGHLQD